MCLAHDDPAHPGRAGLVVLLPALYAFYMSAVVYIEAFAALFAFATLMAGLPWRSRKSSPLATLRTRVVVSKGKDNGPANTADSGSEGKVKDD